MITKGVYKHYKGNKYTVLHIGTHTETGEKFVVYRSMKPTIWLRPYHMFSGQVSTPKGIVKRFTRIEGGE